MTLKKITVLFYLMFAGSPVWAESWLDAWSRQAISAAPTVYQGNHRTYLSGGRLSMRFDHTGQVPPAIMSFSPPSIDPGCGGIDIFGGAIGFLSDVDLMVERYVDIARGAVASYAFSLAYGLLCDKCESITRALSSAATELNKLQLSNCQISKGVKVVGDDWLFNKGAETKKFVNSLRNAVVNGEDELAYDVERSGRYRSREPNLYDACPADYRAIFHSDGSLIRNILTVIRDPSIQDRTYDPEWAETLSAFFGDVQIRNSDEYEFLEGCIENENILNLINNRIYVRNSAGQCVQTQIRFPDQIYPNIYEYIHTNAQQIAEIYFNNDGPVTTELAAFIDSTHPSIISVLTFEVAQAKGDFDPAAFAQDYSDYYAHEYLYDMMRKMKNTMRSVFTGAKTIWLRTEVPDGETECEKELTVDILKYITKIEGEVYRSFAQVENEYRIRHDSLMERFRNTQLFLHMQDVMLNQNITKISTKE